MKFSSRLCSVLTILVFLLLASCMVRSVHPWLKKENVLFEEDLLGGWVGVSAAGKDVAMTFVRGKGNTYEVQYSEGDSHGVFIGLLGKFGSDYFLDFRPKEGAPGIGGLLMFPAHSVARLDIGRDRLTVLQLDYGAFKAEAKLDRLRDLRFAWDDDDELIITSPTDDLQRFLLGLSRDSKLYAPPLRLSRRK